MNQAQQGKPKMHVGVQGIGTSKPELQFLVRFQEVWPDEGGYPYMLMPTV
jgi:hypothetical protein